MAEYQSFSHIRYTFVVELMEKYGLANIEFKDHFKKVKKEYIWNVYKQLVHEYYLKAEGISHKKLEANFVD